MEILTEDQKMLGRIQKDLNIVISTIDKLKNNGTQKRHDNISYLHDVLSRIETNIVQNAANQKAKKDK